MMYMVYRAWVACLLWQQLEGNDAVEGVLGVEM